MKRFFVKVVLAVFIFSRSTLEKILSAGHRDQGGPGTISESFDLSSLLLGSVKSEDAGKDEYPFIVSIRTTDKPGSPHAAGSIIHPQWILTVRNAAVEENESPPIVVKKIHSVVVYPKYSNDFASLTNHTGYEVEKMFCWYTSLAEKSNLIKYQGVEDAALLKLKKPIPLGEPPFNFAKVDMVDPSYTHPYAIRLMERNISLLDGVFSVNLESSPQLCYRKYREA